MMHLMRHVEDDLTVRDFVVDPLKLSRTEAFALIDAICLALPGWERDLADLLDEAKIEPGKERETSFIQARLFCEQRINFAERMIKEIKEFFDDKQR